MQISQNDYLKWWDDPVGKEVKAAIKKLMDDITEDVMNGKWLMNPEQLHYETGKFQTAKQLLNLSYEQLMGEDNGDMRTS
jgi:hypothetical protein